LHWALERGSTDVFLREDTVTSTSSSEAAALFKTKIFAFSYWRGYRQLFNLLGYPGKEKEVELALRELTAGGVLLDASCGPGEITRGLLSSGKFERVVAIDYSSEMCALAREACGGAASVYVADVADLPFADEQFASVHSSAGAHCWGDSSRGFSELFRVCAKGGTILISTVVLLNRTTSEEEYMTSRTANTPFWDAEVVKRMMMEAGFEKIQLVASDKCFVSLKGEKRQ
jgi:ATP-binding cassette subfamily F protein 2